MDFPRHWIRLQESLEPGVRPGRVDAWGWSDSSLAQARQVAEQRLAQAAYAARAGTLPQHGPQWYYPRTPLRENILGQVEDARITRNRYGAVILNSLNLFIADIDLPEPATPAGRGLLGRLFGRVPVGPTQSETDPVDAALAPVRAYAAATPAAGLRSYRTAAGLRVIVTGVDLPAGSPASRDLLEQFGSDPLYVDLSAAYGSYRARLSPKPWRCGMTGAPVARVEPGRGVDHTAFAPPAGWLAAYEQASQPYAVCRLLEVNGTPPTAAERAVIEVHDRDCRVDSKLPLA